MKIRQFWIWAAACAAGVMFPASAVAQAPVAVAPLTSVAEVRALPTKDLLERLPVRLEGLILSRFADRGRFVLYQAGSGLVVKQVGRGVEVPVGARVVVSGTTMLDGWSQVLVTNLDVMASDAVRPTSMRPGFPDFLRTLKPFNDWVELSGLVQSARNLRSGLQLRLRDSEGRIVTVMAPSQAPETVAALLFARVSASGVLMLTEQGNRLLWVDGWEHVRLEEAPAIPPFELPLMRVADAGTKGAPVPGFDRPARLRVEVLSENAAKREFVVRDGTGEARIMRPPFRRLNAGDQIDAVGFLGWSEAGLLLETADVRWLGRRGDDATGGLVPVIESAQAVRALTAEERAAGVPVRIGGAVAYRDPAAGWFHLQQGAAGGVGVEWGGTNTMPERGVRVFVKGLTVDGVDSRIEGRELTIVPTNSLPVPRRVRSGDFVDGRVAGSLVELSGIVRSVAMREAGRMELRIEWRGVIVPVRVNLRNAAPPAGLVDSQVSVVGVAGSEPESHSRRRRAVLLVDGPGELTVEEGPSDAAAPAMGVAELVGQSWPDTGARRVRVVGTVTSVRGARLTVDDGQRGCLVQLLGAGGAAVGERVEAAGFPVSSGGVARLDDAVLRGLGAGELPAELALSAAEMLGEPVDYRRVRVQGLLIGQSPGTHALTLLIRAKGLSFTADLPVVEGLDSGRPWENGSELMVSGVCRQQFESGGLPESFQVLLAGPESVRVLAVPPWLTRERTVGVVAGMGLMLVAVLGWAAFLRKRAEQSRGQFLTTFDASPMPAWIVDFKVGRYMTVNAQYLRIFECSREEMNGRPVTECFVWETEQQRMHFMTQLKREGRVNALEARLRARGGNVMNMMVSAEPIRFEDEDCVLIIAYDVTERLKLLEQLRQSQKMEAVGQLAAGVAHDFNNLLTVIRGNSELMRTGGGLDADSRDLNEEVDQAAARAADLTRQLLAFSRKQVMRRSRLDLRDAINRATGMLGRLLGETILVHNQPAEQALPVKADAGMLDQVILNLAVNARDAMPGGGELALMTQKLSFDEATRPDHPDAAAGDFAVLSVADTGTGMPEAVRRHVFDPFFTTKAVGKGTGLGLATVYGIVHQHGGWVDVRSTPGEGTTFLVYLPLTTEDPDSEGQELPSDIFGRGTETILVVEDEAPVRAMLSRTLSRYGYTVLEAADGTQAEALWQERGAEIDLLLTDIVMPNGISGLGLAACLRAQRAELKVIFMTGYSEDLVEHGGMLKAGEDFLPKPFDRSELIRLVRKRLAPGEPA